MTGSSDILADPIDVNQMVGNLTNAKVWRKQYEAGHLRPKSIFLKLKMKYLRKILTKFSPT